jgi:hypothetical protein
VSKFSYTGSRWLETVPAIKTSRITIDSDQMGAWPLDIAVSLDIMIPTVPVHSGAIISAPLDSVAL